MESKKLNDKERILKKCLESITMALSEDEYIAVLNAMEEYSNYSNYRLKMDIEKYKRQVEEVNDELSKNGAELSIQIMSLSAENERLKEAIKEIDIAIKKSKSGQIVYL